MNWKAPGLTVWIVVMFSVTYSAALCFSGWVAPLPAHAMHETSGPPWLRDGAHEASGWTQQSQLVFDAALMNASQVWLAGLFDESEESAESVESTPALSLRWVQDRSLWIPRWSLELIARPGLLPDALIDRHDGGHDVIVLVDSLMPVRGQQYRAKLSYDSQTRDLSFFLRSDSTESVLIDGQLRIEGTQRLTSPKIEAIQLTHPHIDAHEVKPGYERLGSPLALTRDLTWEWVRIQENDVVRQGGFLFWDVETPGMRVVWPPVEVPGVVHVSLWDDHDLVEEWAIPWSPVPTLISVQSAELRHGDYTVRMTYTDGSHKQILADERLRIAPTKITADYELGDRDYEDHVRVYVTLRTEANPGALPFTLHARYVDDRGSLLQAWTEKQHARLVSGRPTVLEYALSVPPDPGTMELGGETGEGINLESMNEQFAVPPAPTLRTWPVHAQLPTEIGRPAVLPPGAKKPQVGVRTLRSGVIRGEVLQDGVSVAQIPAREITAKAVETLALPDSLGERGIFEVRIKLEETESDPAAYHAFTFALGDENDDMGGVSQIVFVGDDGKLRYIPDAKGNRIPDFSFAGYRGGGVALPTVPVHVVVKPEEGDATERLQAAIDEVSNLPLNEDGFRGAVLLREGRYEVERPLYIRAGGVVLRGEGTGDDGTVLVATGREAYNLIEVQGPRAYRADSGSTRPIRDMYVPVGAHTFHVDDTDGFHVGDTVVVRRFGNAAWIQAIGMDQIADRPGDPDSTQQWQPFTLEFERVITALEANQMTIDVPIIQTIDAQWGGGEVFRVTDERISQVGVENLKAVSYFNPEIECTLSNGTTYPCDEDHAHYLVRFNYVKDAWLRDVETVHFVHGPVQLASGSKQVTVQDAASYEPVSIITGSRRYPYASNGQLNLIQRVYSQGARHAFSVGARVTGPNVFLHSTSEDDHATSEPHHRWSVGGLYDNVSGPIQIQDRQWYGTGQGWSGAYYVTWNTKGVLVVQKPPTAQNWAIGHVGTKQYGDFGPREDGHWESLGQHVQPASLYLQQLEDRLGPGAVRQISR